MSKDAKRVDYHKLTNDFLASLSILQSSIEGFHAGTRDAYRILAVELRKLMCDGKSSLLPHLFESLELRKFSITLQAEMVPSIADAMKIVAPGIVSMRDGKPRFFLDFASDNSTMPLDAWLGQRFVGHWSVREFIRSVADKEGAHADVTYNDTLEWAKSAKFGLEDGHPMFIVGIAEYLFNVLHYEHPRLRKGIPLKRGPRQGEVGPDAGSADRAPPPSNLLYEPGACRICGAQLPPHRSAMYCDADSARVTALHVRCKVAADLSIRSGGRVPYTLRQADVVELAIRQGWKCAVSGIPFTTDTIDSHTSPWAASLDRLSVKRGFELANVRLVAWAYSLLKSHWSDELASRTIQELAAGIGILNASGAGAKPSSTTDEA